MKKNIKYQFTITESREIRKLLDYKNTLPSNEQINPRNRLRSMGFYISVFTKSTKGFTSNDFEKLIDQHKITII
jgi:hypothetical protein